MFLLSPAKLLVILVVALMVLGPDKLPAVAKKVGGLWSEFRAFREKLETEVRGTFPDLPSTESITDAVRAPLTFLDSLANDHEEGGRTTAGTTAPSERDDPSLAAWEREPSALGSVDGADVDDPPAARTAARSAIPVAHSVAVPHQGRADQTTGVDHPELN